MRNYGLQEIWGIAMHGPLKGVGIPFPKREWIVQIASLLNMQKGDLKG